MCAQKICSASLRERWPDQIRAFKFQDTLSTLIQLQICASKSPTIICDADFQEDIKTQ